MINTIKTKITVHVDHAAVRVCVAIDVLLSYVLISIRAAVSRP